MFDYATHVPILAHLILEHKIKNVMETGMGDYSTPLFVAYCNHVFSIEMDKIDWFEKVCKRQGVTYLFHPFLALQEKEYINAIREIPPVDMAFIDGYGIRSFQVNSVFHKTNIIVMHDTQEECHEWKGVVIPDKTWQWVDVTSYPTWTGVLTTRQDVVDSLRRVFKTQDRNI